MVLTEDKVLTQRDRLARAALLAVFVLNAAVTLIHFIALFTGIMPRTNPIALVMRIAVPDTIVAVLLSFVAAWGLWRSRLWAIWLAMIAIGAYFHGQIELIVMALQGELGLAMAMVSVYLVLFNGLFAVYLWRNRTWLQCPVPRMGPILNPTHRQAEQR